MRESTLLCMCGTFPEGKPPSAKATAGAYSCPVDYCFWQRVLVTEVASSLPVPETVSLSGR